MILIKEIKSKINNRQFYKFFLVGLLNALIDFSIFNFILIFFNINPLFFNYLIIKFISAFLAITNSFYWNRKWVFKSKELFNVTCKETVLFYFIAFSGLFVSSFSATTFFYILENYFIYFSTIINANIGIFLGLTIVIFWDFFGYKYLVFKNCDN